MTDETPTVPDHEVFEHVKTTVHDLLQNAVSVTETWQIETVVNEHETLIRADRILTEHPTEGDHDILVCVVRCGPYTFFWSSDPQFQFAVPDPQLSLIHI